ncbi:hypothetical protein OH77DRAFT_1531242 [Trametes cingulata]|nr:hypothetical protein OH77DRAFT_1531242 [Trametes cingulata]
MVTEKKTTSGVARAAQSPRTVTTRSTTRESGVPTGVPAGDVNNDNRVGEPASTGVEVRSDGGNSLSATPTLASSSPSPTSSTITTTQQSGNVLPIIASREPGNIAVPRRSPSPDWPVSPFGLKYADDIMERVRLLTHMEDKSSNRYGLTKIPRGSTWGSRDASLDDVLCHDGRPVITFLVGEVESASFTNEIGDPLKFIRIAIKPMYHSDVVAAHRMLRQHSHNVHRVEEFQIGIVEAGRRQSRRTRNSRNTTAYEFKYVYDASSRYGPKATMPQLTTRDIGYRDLVLVECKFIRFRADADTGKATYFISEWTSWRARFDIVSICRLQESGDDLESDGPSDNDDIPVV